MKATGIVRRVDDLGRIVLPKELRRMLNIKEADSLEIFTDHEGIYLRKFDITATASEALERVKNLVTETPELNRPDVLQKVSELGKLLEACKTS